MALHLVYQKRLKNFWTLFLMKHMKKMKLLMTMGIKKLTLKKTMNQRI